jgi:hypothetical protein
VCAAQDHVGKVASSVLPTCTQTVDWHVCVLQLRQALPASASIANGCKFVCQHIANGWIFWFKPQHVSHSMWSALQHVIHNMCLAPKQLMLFQFEVKGR